MMWKFAFLALFVCLFETLSCKGEELAKQNQDKSFLVLQTRNLPQCFNLCLGTKPCKRITFNVKTKECSLLQNEPDFTANDAKTYEYSRRHLIIFQNMPEYEEKTTTVEPPTEHTMNGIRSYFLYKSNQAGCAKRPCKDYELCNWVNNKHQCFTTDIDERIGLSTMLNVGSNTTPSPKTPTPNITSESNATYCLNGTLESNETSILCDNKSTNLSTSNQPTYNTTENYTEEPTTTIVHNQVPTTEVDATILHNQVPTTEVDATIVHNQVPTTEVDATILHNQVPTTKVDATIVHNQLPTTEVDATIVQNQVPTTEVDATIVHNQVPTTEVDATILHNQVPTTDVDATILHNQVPTTEVDATILHNQFPTTKVDATIVHNQLPTTEVDATILHNQFPTTSKTKELAMSANKPTEQTIIDKDNSHDDSSSTPVVLLL